jgi:putative FmdB family regulatory protein
MPIYEYRCQACGLEQEVLQKISEPALSDCPECGKPSLKKLVSAAGFQLKGTGWYVTDFRDKNKGGGKKEEKESGTQSEKVAAEKPGNGKSEVKASGDKSDSTSAAKSANPPSKKGGGGATADA